MKNVIFIIIAAIALFTASALGQGKIDPRKMPVLKTDGAVGQIRFTDVGQDWCRFAIGNVSGRIRIQDIDPKNFKTDKRAVISLLQDKRVVVCVEYVTPSDCSKMAVYLLSTPSAQVSSTK